MGYYKSLLPFHSLLKLPPESGEGMLFNSRDIHHWQSLNETTKHVIRNKPVKRDIPTVTPISFSRTSPSLTSTRCKNKHQLKILLPLKKTYETSEKEAGRVLPDKLIKCRISPAPSYTRCKNKQQLKILLSPKEDETKEINVSSCKSFSSSVDIHSSDKSQFSSSKSFTRCKNKQQLKILLLKKVEKKEIEVERISDPSITNLSHIISIISFSERYTRCKNKQQLKILLSLKEKRRKR